jgi:hypothetical protein
MAIQNIGTTISGIASDTKPTLTANEKGVIFIETDTNKIFQWDTDSWNQVITSTDVAVGALDSGSITSNFGTINTGASAITTTGLISGGSLDIDDVLINGTTIGHTNDTDLITVADGIVTIAGEISATTLDIGGTNVTSTAAELNLLDGVSGLVQADFTKLAAIDATAAEIDLLDALDRGSILYGNASGATTVLGQGSADQVLTSDGTDIAWQDAGGGGGTLEIGHQGAIPAGAPVALDSNGRAVVISGLGNDLRQLGAKHNPTSGTQDNPSGVPIAGTDYNSYGTSLVDAGATGMIMVRVDSGYARIRVTVGTYSQTAGTTAGTREIQWGTETTIGVTNSTVCSAAWNTADNLLCILYVDGADGARPKMVQYPITNKTLGSASTILELKDEAALTRVLELEWDENDNRYIALYSNDYSAGPYHLMCGVYQNSGGNPAQVIAPTRVTGDASGSYATMKWADGGAGKDDCGLIVYQDHDDSQYIKAVGVTHNNSDTITFTGTEIEPFGADKAYGVGDKPRDSGNISFDTTAPPAAGGFATGDDVFVVALAGTDADGDHIPYVVPVSVDSSDCSLVAGTVETPYVEFPAYWRTNRSGATSLADVADMTPMHSKEGHHLAICYDPDRDTHVLVFGHYNYYENPDNDGGQWQDGMYMVSQTLTLNASDNSTIDNTYNTAYHPMMGNRQNHSVQAANRTINMGIQKLFYYGVLLNYHKTYDTMFVLGQTYVVTDMDSEYEYRRHLLMAFNGQTTAQGGSAALTYAPSNVDRIIGFNTTAMSDTGTSGNVTISLPGSENTNQTGLTTGKKYFIADSGTLTEYRAMASRNFLVGGIATSASTKIMPKLNTLGIQI